MTVGKPRAKRFGLWTTLIAIIAIIAVIWVISSISSWLSERSARQAADEAKAIAAQRMEAKRHEFAASKAQVLAEIESKIAGGDYDGALSTAARYSTVRDPDLAAAKDRAREMQLLAHLAKTPKSDLEARRAAFAELATLVPSNSEYAAQRDAYRKAVADAEAKRKAQQEAERKAAIAALRKTTDKVEGITWYHDPTSPQTNRSKAFYLYIGEKSGSLPWLRLRVQYYADDWLFVQNYVVSVEGMKLEGSGRAADWERDNDSDIWEWLDVTPTSADLAMIVTVVESKDATLRYNGRQYYKDVKITAQQKAAFKRVLLAYEAMGGK